MNSKHARFGALVAALLLTANITKLSAAEGTVIARASLGADAGILIVDEGEAGATLKYSGSAEDMPKNGAVIAASGGTFKAGVGTVKSAEGNLPKVSVAKAEDIAAGSDDIVNRYVVLPGATLAAGTFKGGSIVDLSYGGSTVKMLVPQALDGREAPAHALNLFGSFTKASVAGSAEGSMTLIPTRFVPASSKDSRMLATKHTCLTCHQMDVKLVGPSYTQIAEKYKNDPDAIAKMVEQMTNGGSGKWGPVPMLPFKGRVSEEEMTQLASWIYEMRWDFVLND